MSAVKPGDLLEIANDIADWWLTREGYMYAAAFTEDVIEKNRLEGMDVSKIAAETLAGAQAVVLKLAVPFFIADNMVQVCQGASKTMPKQPILESDLPAKTGFMWLEDVFIFRDVHNQGVAVRAIQWNTNETHVGIALYSDPLHPDDEMQPSQYTVTTPEGLLFAGQWALEFGKDYSDVDHLLYDVRRRKEVENEAWALAIKNMADLFKFILTTWTLMQQFIRYQHKVMIHRASRRRLARRKREIQPIVYVTLRRMEDDGWQRDPNAEQRGVQWSHRWIVNGYWRNRKGKDGSYRQEYVMPHEKGPAHLPLIEKDRIYILKR
jgi:hypothetical protein